MSVEKKETKVALKEYKYRGDEYGGKYWEYRKEYEKLLETKCKRWQDKRSEFINDFIKQKDIKRIWEAVRSIVNKRDYNTANVSPDSWIKHFGDLFNKQELDLSVGKVQILGPHYIKELDMDFTNQVVKKFIMNMKNNKATGFDGIPAEVWKVLSTNNEGIGILMDLFNKIKNKKIYPSE
jgi:hypothetical protein